MDTIAAWRKRQGLTQQALAEMIGSSVTSVANWEQGRYDPSAVMLLRLADALGGIDPRLIALPSLIDTVDS